MKKITIPMTLCLLVADVCLAGKLSAGSSGTGRARDVVSSLEDLQAVPVTALPGIFDQAAAPGVEEFRGHTFRGRILHINYQGIGRLVYSCYTGGWFKALIGRPDPAGLSFTKIFYPERQPSGAHGINYWPLLQRQSMPMRIYIGPCLEGKGDSLKVDYNLPVNDALTERPLVDEIRRVPGTAPGTDLYLGRMYFRFGMVLPLRCSQPNGTKKWELVFFPGKHKVLFLWFALERNGR